MFTHFQALDELGDFAILFYLYRDTHPLYFNSNPIEGIKKG
jgi:hypothetical protein